MTRTLLNLARTTLLVSSVVWLSSSGIQAQSAKPLRVLVLYWDDKDYPANVLFERDFQSALRSIAHGPVEFYSEYLETTRFPGEDQSRFLRDYIRGKYADRPIDVVVPNASEPLNFLFKYRGDILPETPIVFGATNYPSAAQLESGAGATGIVFVNSYRQTLDLALSLHPHTERVFIVSGTPTHDKLYETMARSQLKEYGGKAAITYLTDLPLEDLMARIKGLPDRSIVLYASQQARDSRGKLLESRDVLQLIAPSARVPMYGMSLANVGLGIVGGYVYTSEANAKKLAEMTLQVASGIDASNIPVESAPTTPMFDRRQLQRWDIREDSLPDNSIIRFREAGIWERYKWRMLGVLAVLALQTLLIGTLLLERRRAKLSATALMTAQRVLRESEERFRNVANTAPVMIVLTNANRLSTFFNKTWLDFTGRAIEQELGMGWSAGVHPDDREACLMGIDASYEKRSECRLEYRLLRADGQYRSLICSGVPRFETDGVFSGYIASLVDVTDLKKSQVEALASQKLESLGVLASGIAHDFNNLLGSILAIVELLLTDLADRAAVRQELGKIRLISTRASEIVRQLMVYAGEESTTFETVDLATLVREMLQLMMVGVSKNAVLKIDVPADVPPVFGNPPQLRQVMMNLITNASDALRENGGEISVTLKPVHAQTESPENLSEDFLRLEVRDTGCGMPEEVRDRIFDPFFSTKQAGRGMGLAAVQGIIMSHGGTIRVETTVGSGSCFEILLPCVARTDRQRHDVLKPAPVLAEEKANGTVLIIDDEDALRLSLTSLLRKYGYTVFEARDGTTALDIFASHSAKIDVVLLDLTLPNMSGAEILLRLRQIRPNIKIVLSTAYGRDRALRDVNDQNFVYYLRKPYEISELTTLLREVRLDKRNSMNASAG